MEDDVDLERFKEMDKPELLKYLEFLLWHYRLVDAFWFIYVEEQFDRATAERFNEMVWAKVGQMGAREIVKSFDIKEKGLKGFVKAFKIWPWQIIAGYNIEEKEDEVFISAASCPPQDARIKRGLGEYDCKEMHRQEFELFAHEVDPNIKVECLFAPLDPHPQGLYCKWRFTMPGS